MERTVLAAATIDPDVLRQELKAVVRELASQFGSQATGEFLENPSMTP
jgi:hypothetical protein